MNEELKQRITNEIKFFLSSYVRKEEWPTSPLLLEECLRVIDSLESALADEREVVEHLKARINTTRVNAINNVADARDEIRKVIDALPDKIKLEFYRP